MTGPTDARMDVALERRRPRHRDVWFGVASVAGLGAAVAFRLNPGFDGQGAFALCVFLLTFLLPASALMLTVNACRYRTKVRASWVRLLLLAVLIGLPASYFTTGLHTWLDELVLRRQVTWAASPEELQRAVIPLIDRQQRTEREEITLSSTSPGVPAVVRRLHPEIIWVFRTGKYGEGHVVLLWGSGFGHWGVAVGRPTYRAGPNSSRWADGVYGLRTG